MSLYRYKKSPDGLRQLVELWETLPAARRQKIVDVSRGDDPQMVELALSLLISFDDITKLPDLELAEVIGEAPARSTGYAINGLPKEIQDRFLRNSHSTKLAEIRDCVESTGVSAVDRGGGQVKLIEVTRKLEREGKIRFKKIPKMS